MIALPPWLTLRLVATFVISLGLFAIGWKAGATLTEARWQRVQVKAEREHIAALARAREAERASFAKSQEVSREYQTRLAAIRAERDRLRALPVRPVRLCVERPRPASMPSAGAVASGSRTTSADTAAPALEAGGDIGGRLYNLVDDGDQREAELAEQVRKLQAVCVVKATGVGRM